MEETLNLSQPTLIITPGVGDLFTVQCKELDRYIEFYENEGIPYGPRRNGYVLATSSGSVITYLAARCSWDRQLFKAVCQKLTTDAIFKSRFSIPRGRYSPTINDWLSVIFFRSSVYTSPGLPTINNGIVEFFRVALTGITGKDELCRKAMSNSSCGFPFHFLINTYDVNRDMLIPHLLEPEIASDGRFLLYDMLTGLRCVDWPKMANGKYGFYYYFPTITDGTEQKAVDITTSFTESFERVRSSASIPIYAEEQKVNLFSHYLREEKDGIVLHNNPKPQEFHLLDGIIGETTPIDLFLQAINGPFTERNEDMSKHIRSLLMRIPFRIDTYNTCDILHNSDDDSFEYEENFLSGLISTLIVMCNSSIRRDAEIADLYYNRAVRYVLERGGDYTESKIAGYEMIGSDANDGECPLVFIGYRRYGSYIPQPPIEINFGDPQFRPETNPDGSIPLADRWNRFDTFIREHGQECDLIVFQPQFYSLSHDETSRLMFKSRPVTFNSGSFRNLLRYTHFFKKYYPNSGWRCLMSKFDFFPTTEYREQCRITVDNFDGIDTSSENCGLYVRARYVLARTR